MAKLMKAIKTYMPAIERHHTLAPRQLISYLSGRSNLSEGAIDHVLYELRDAIIYFGSMGQAIKLVGVGTFTPMMQLDGSFTIKYLPDKEIKNRLNDEKSFSGKIKNKEMLGKTTQDLIDRWNQEHPEDPIEE